MLKLVKFLKPFVLLVIFVVLLLFVQAVSDLSLPDYMSRIINVGIQQGGIENAAPEVIRKSRMDVLLLLLDEEERSRVLNGYELLDAQNLPAAELDRYARRYPLLRQEPLYRLQSSGKGATEALSRIMGPPLLILSEMEKNGYEPGTLPSLPPQQAEAMIEAAMGQITRLPESIVLQAAVSYIGKEYRVIGLDTKKIQNRFILGTGVIMLCVALISMAATVLVGYLGARVAAGMARNMRRSVFTRVVDFANAEFDRFSTASLITRSTNDIQQIQMLMVMLLRVVFYAPILGIGGLLKVMKSDGSMSWIIGIAVGSIFLLVALLFGVAIPRFKTIQKLVDRLNLATREMLSGILVIRAFNNQKLQERKFEEANRDLTRTNLFVNRIMALMMPAMMLIMNGITLLIVWVGAHRVDLGVMQVGDMMAFIQYSMQIIMAFLMISMVSIMLPRAAVSAERVSEVLETESSVKDLPETRVLPESGPVTVEFRNVSFRYPGAEENALTDISFVAGPGQTTAIIGSTGSGKTTLLNLLPRFYDVTGGGILLNGTDIRELSLHELREIIGYAPQKAVLFSGTVRSNLAYGAKSKTDDELLEAVEIAQAADFVNTMPKGMDSEIAQGGTNVSGGQKQRLSIARALVKRPKIFLFDDSFSALDFRTDAALRRALKKYTKDSTVFIVAQRISTVMGADQIIVLENGKLAGKGTHDELMRTCEVYRQIAYSQLSKEELA